ncbi:MAG: adenine deaminase C-terminal domain-containing protein, partial [Methanomassiliicoccales archaeon]
YLPTGVVAVGKPADLVIVEDIREFNVLEVYIGGEMVAKDGKALFEASPAMLSARTIRRDIPAEQLAIKHEGSEAYVRVIVVDPDQIETAGTVERLLVEGGSIVPDPAKDVLLLAVVNRYIEAPPALGFVRGFKFKRGAAASTVAHDSHNIIVVGVDRESMARAISKVSTDGGYHVTDGNEEASLALNIAGLMSTEPCANVIEDERAAIELMRRFGCDLPAPFVTLSFLSLLVVPSLRLSDKGLFDSRSFKFVDAVVDGPK